LGRGLGTAPGIGERFKVQGHLTTEDAYLQVGNEIGVLSMLSFLGLLLSTIVALARRARSADPDGLATAMCAAGVGLFVGGFFLHIWLDFATALTFWALAGLALGGSSALPRLPSRPA
jgi:O-antigen ligase